MADAAQRWEPTVAGGSTGTEEVQETAREKAEDLKDAVRESSTQLSSTARGWATQEADQRTSAIASQARTIAGAMRQTSSKLEQDGQPQAARLTDSVAGRVDQIAEYLDQADGERLMSDVQDLARRNPWAFAVAGLVAGFAASRFMKASRTDDTASTRSMPAYGAAYGTEPAAYGAAYGTEPAAYGDTGGYGDTGSTGA